MNENLQQYKITCSNCGSPVSIEDSLLLQFKETIRKDLQQTLREKEESLLEKQAEFDSLVEKLEQDRLELESIISTRTSQQLKSQQQQLVDSIREQVSKEKEELIFQLETELETKSKGLVSARQNESKLRRLNLEYEEKLSEAILEKDREMEQRIDAIVNSTKSSMEEKIQLETLKLKEAQAVISGLQKQLSIANEKARQGSMQTQGEVTELYLESAIQESFRSDLITPIPTGRNGCDFIQTVRTETGRNCATIAWEVKQTANWSNDFIDKAKRNNLNIHKCDVVIIATRTLPKGVERFALIDGVWVCKIHEAKFLGTVLRYGLLRVFAVKSTLENQTDKIQILYNYLNSQEFHDTFSMVLDSLRNLEEQHLKEQKSLNVIWRKRELFISSALHSVISFYSSLKGLSDGEIPGDIDMLEEYSSAS
ncbi:MAG: DUF2130 domain-containing protein [Bacteroidota bacterium]